MSINIERLKRDRTYWDGVAPEGATHVMPKTGKFATGVFWFKKIHNYKWMVFSRYEEESLLRWCDSPGTSDGDHFIPRPEPATEWDGDLPPVGTICEFRPTGGPLNHGKHIDWLQCEVIATTRAYAILRHIGVAYSDNHECSHYLRHVEFRPIRTKAERDREELVALITGGGYLHDSGDEAHRIADAILTAGWQKGDNSE